MKADPGMKEREVALLLAVAAGDQEALRELYRSFERPLFALGVRWFAGDRSMAEELVQEVTLRIWRRATTFDRTKGAAGSWIFGIARNVAADLARANRRHPTPTDAPIEAEWTGWDEDAAWESWEVARAIRTLPLEQQKVIELAYVCSYTHSETARTLGIPLGTVKTRLKLALAKLEVALADRGVIEEVHG